LTRIRKKPLFNDHFFCLAVLIIPLAVIFLYAFHQNSSIFYILTAGFVAVLFFLFPLRQGLIHRLSLIQIRREEFQEARNLVEAEIQRERSALKDLEKKILRLSQLKLLTEKLTYALTIAESVQTLSVEISKIFGIPLSAITLRVFHSSLENSENRLSPQKGMSRNNQTWKEDVFDAWVISHHQPLLVEDTKNDYRFDEEKILLEQVYMIRSVVIVPLVSGSLLIGMLRINSGQAGFFSIEDLRFLTTIGEMGSLVVENAQLYERVKEMAIRDGLTGLYLRRYLMEQLSLEIERHHSSRESLSFLMIDLDHFKQYNDRYGHVAGDIVLRTVAVLLRDMFSGQGDLVGRYGGEEFCVVLAECSKNKALEMAEAFRGAVEKKDIVLRRQKTRVSISVGVASFPEDASGVEELMGAADQALYKAKSAGRNRVMAAGEVNGRSDG
jgi:diguanylate cyclase (GGDEF)-like protein